MPIEEGPCRCWVTAPPVPHQGHCCFGDDLTPVEEVPLGSPPPCGHWHDDYPQGGVRRSPDGTTGKTGWCSHGRHDRCPYRPGGPCEGGIARSEEAGGGRYMCPCECHSSGVPVQAELFNEEEL